MEYTPRDHEATAVASSGLGTRLYVSVPVHVFSECFVFVVVGFGCWLLVVGFLILVFGLW